MQEAFQHGFQSYYKEDNQWQVLPDKDFYQSLVAEGAEAYEAVNNDGQRVGGAIIAIDATILRPSQHPLLHQPLRISCRRVLQRTSSRPAHARAV